jgi:glycosyltransferase involved in cell wall biosynthesis
LVLRRVAARFVLIGEDSTTAAGGSQRAELEAQLRQANALDSVEFAGEVDQAALGDWYRGADICVVPSLLYESFSYTCAQAMAWYKPVVATRIGGIPETVEDGVTGSIVEPGDVGQLADALVRLAQDAGLRAAMGRAGREKALGEFDARKVAKDNLEVYARAISHA